MVSRLPQTTEREFYDAVQAAKDAYPKWRNTALPTRSRVMFKFQELIRQHMVRLTERTFICIGEQACTQLQGAYITQMAVLSLPTYSDCRCYRACDSLIACRMS